MGTFDILLQRKRENGEDELNTHIGIGVMKENLTFHKFQLKAIKILRAIRNPR